MSAERKEQVELSRREIEKVLAGETRRRRNRERRRRRARMRRRAIYLLALAGGGALAVRSYLEKPVQGGGTVVMADEEPGPLSVMLGELAKGLLQDPQKKAIADKMRFSVAIQDFNNPDMASTIKFQGSDITLYNGVEPDADVHICAELSLLLSLSGAGKGLQVFKWLQSEDGKKVLDALKGGRFIINGLSRRPLQMAHFMKFLTPAG